MPNNSNNNNNIQNPSPHNNISNHQVPSQWTLNRSVSLTEVMTLLVLVSTLFTFVYNIGGKVESNTAINTQQTLDILENKNNIHLFNEAMTQQRLEAKNDMNLIWTRIKESNQIQNDKIDRLYGVILNQKIQENINSNNKKH